MFYYLNYIRYNYFASFLVSFGTLKIKLQPRYSYSKCDRNRTEPTVNRGN